MCLPLEVLDGRTEFPELHVWKQARAFLEIWKHPGEKTSSCHPVSEAEHLRPGDARRSRERWVAESERSREQHRPALWPAGKQGGCGRRAGSSCRGLTCVSHGSGELRMAVGRMESRGEKRLPFISHKLSFFS